MGSVSWHHLAGALPHRALSAARAPSPGRRSAFQGDSVASGDRCGNPLALALHHDILSALGKGADGASLAISDVK